MSLLINNTLNDQSPKEREYLSEVHSIVQAPDRREDAIKALEAFIQRHPDFAPAYNNLGVIYYETGDREKALSFYKKAVELEGNNRDFLKNLADFYLAEEGRIEDALRLYIKALEVDNEDVEIYLILGNICAQMNNLDDARFFYDRALEIEPWNLNAMDNLDYLEEYQK